MNDEIILKQSSNSIRSTKYTNINLIEYVFPWIIILSIYRIGPLSIADIALISLIIINFLWKTKIKIISKQFIILCFLIIFQSLILYIAHGNIQIINNLFTVMISMFLILFLPSYINMNNLYITYKIPAALSMIGVLFHSYSIYINKSLVSPILLFPQLVNDLNIVTNSNRPVSFFSEPQAVATYLLPLFILSLKKKDYFWTIIILITILFTGSSLGIIAYTVILIVANFKFINSKPYKIMVIGVVILFFSVLTRLEVLNFALEKVLNIDFKTDIRISNGFYLLNSLSTSDKFFGIGIGNINYFFNRNSIPYISEYVSSIAGTLIYFGTFISGYYFYFLWRQLSISKREKKLFIITVIILSFGQSILFNTWFTLFMVIYFSDYLDNSLA